MPRLNQVDPTRTKSLRKRMERRVRTRFKQLEKSLEKLIVEDDVLGLSPRSHLVGNQSELWSVQLNILDPEVQSQIAAIQQLIDPADVLEFEDQPHITVRFGFKENIQSGLKRILDEEGIIDFRFGRLSAFKGEKQDVLYLEIKSQRLKEIHHHLGIFPHEDSHPTYVPHLTLAYLQPGVVDRYLDLHNPLFGLAYFQQYEVVLSSPQRVQTALVSNVREWEFLSDESKLQEFEQWLANETGLTIVAEEDRLWDEIVQQGYERGAGRAYTDTNKRRDAAQRAELGQQSKAQFLQFTLSAPETREKVRLLAARVLTDIQGVATVLATQLRKELVDGLVEGANPREIARRMSQRLGTSVKHAERIARTEMIRAHAEGQLDSMERLGVDEVGVAVEWSTAQDDRVCPLCADMEGVVLKTKEAHGLLPRHPNCRCSWIPANVGENTRGQVRTKAAIVRRFKRSIGKEKQSRWVGRRRRIASKRPKLSI